MEQKEMLALLKSQMHMTYAERDEIAVHMNALAERLHQQEADIEKLVQERGTMKASSPTMEWISVEERLPKSEFVLCTDGEYVFVDIIPDMEDAIEDGVTHWMPLPEPPKQKELTFRDVFLKKFPKAVYLDVDCCTIFPEQFNHDSCDYNCNACWNQPYFELKEEGGE